jgi:hypothetical protein
MTPTQHRTAILSAATLGELDAAAATAAAAEKISTRELDNLHAYAAALITGDREPIGTANARWLKSATLGEWYFGEVLNYAAAVYLERRGYHLVTCNRYIMFAYHAPWVEPGALYAIDVKRGEVARAETDARFPDVRTIYANRYHYAPESLMITGTARIGKTPIYRLSNGQAVSRKHFDAAQRLRGHGTILSTGMAGQLTRPICIDSTDGLATGMIMPMHPERTTH